MEIDTEKFTKMRTRILRRKFQVAKNQAAYRHQVWELKEEEFFLLWESDTMAWLESGTSSADMNLSRIDMEAGWTLDNVHLVARRDMLAAQGRSVKLRNSRPRAPEV